MLGYFLALAIGTSLGLLGGGGSILTVPVMVYLLNISPKTSIILSLAVVGVASLFGAAQHKKKGNVNIKMALLFAPSAMFGAFLGAKISTYIAGQTQLILFSIVMLMAAISMLKKTQAVNTSEQTEKVPLSKKTNTPLVILSAFFVGIITGIVGVGGGFLIVPALVFLTQIEMKESVGTSLLIISLNSLSGFIGHIGEFNIEWWFLLRFTLFTVIGIFIGAKLSSTISQARLKRVFAIFLIVMGLFILYQNIQVFT